MAGKSLNSPEEMETEADLHRRRKSQFQSYYLLISLPIRKRQNLLLPPPNKDVLHNLRNR